MLGNKCGQPVLVVKYEDLKKDRTAEVYTYTYMCTVVHVTLLHVHVCLNIYMYIICYSQFWL